MFYQKFPNGRYVKKSRILPEEEDFQLLYDLDMDPEMVARNLKRYDRILVKAGGEIVEDPDFRDNLARDLVFLSRYGIITALVHGGKNRISKYMNEDGLEFEFKDGVRKTPRAAMYKDRRKSRKEGVLNLAPVPRALIELNIEIVENIRRYGLDAESVINTIWVERDTGKGFVGQPSAPGIPVPYCKAFWHVARYFKGMHMDEEFKIPVISPICIDPKETILNVNADMVAEEISWILGARKSVFLSNQPGVLDEKGSLISELDGSEAEKMIERGIISGGMKPKVECALRASRKGIPVSIIDGTQSHSLLREMVTDKGYGTQIRYENEAA